MSKQHHRTTQSVFEYAGEGLRRHKSSSVYYAWFKHAGKQIHRSLGTTDKAHARRLLNEMRQDVANVTSNEATRVTFSQLAARWLASIRPALKPGSVTRRETCIRNLEPCLRTVTLSGVTAGHCEQWSIRRGGKIAPQTLNHELGTLKLIFNYAIEQGIIYRNPARSIKRRRIVPTREKFIPTREQFTKLIAAVRKSDGRPESQTAARHGADFVELLAYSGIRKAEAAALKWRDVDFAKNQLTVTGGANRTKNYETRPVPISAELRELLLRLRAGSQAGPVNNVARISDLRKQRLLRK